MDSLVAVKNNSGMYHRMMDIVGMKKFGDDGYPPEAGTVRYTFDGNKLRQIDSGSGLDYRVFASNNDGFELWFGTGNEWEWSLESSEVRLLTKYIIWNWWVKSRWLGIRRPLYYWALHKHIEKWRHGAA